MPVRFWLGPHFLKETNMLQNIYVKNILLALAVAVFGFLLLNLTFILDALFVRLVGLFLPADFPMTHGWYPPLMHILFVIIIGIISWFIFKSKIKETYKAIYSTVPWAVIFVTIGIFLYRWPALVYGVGVLAFGVILACLYQAKKFWFYYFALILVALTLLIIGIMGVDI